MIRKHGGRIFGRKPNLPSLPLPSLAAFFSGASRTLLEMEAVGGSSHESEEASISAADQHHHDDVTAAATASEPAAAIDLFEIPTNTGEWVANELTVDPETTSPDQCSETSPGEKKIDDATANNIRQQSSTNGGVLLSFGDFPDVNQESINVNHSNIIQEAAAPNNFDFLSFRQPETAVPLYDSSDIFSGGPLSDIEATEKAPVATVDSELDILGLSHMGNEPQNLSSEQKPEKDVLCCTAASPDENDPENEDVSAKKLESTHPESINSITEKDNENASVIDEACLWKQESICERIADHEEVNVPGKAKTIASNDDNSMAEDRSRILAKNEEGMTTFPCDEVSPVFKDASEELLQSISAREHNEQGGNLLSYAAFESVDEEGISGDNHAGKILQEQQSNEMEDTKALGTIENNTHATAPLIHVATTTNLSPNTSQQSLNIEVDGAVKMSVDAEDRTEEEEEWLSMGLGLGDALRQIVALTDEKDLALVVCQEKDNRRIQVEALFEEVQSRLEAEMNRRAESDCELRKVRENMKLYEERLAAYEKLEDDLEKANASIVTLVTEKSKVEMDVAKLREMIEESEQKEAVLSNRLNEAKKKEANKASTAGRLDAENEQLREDLQKTRDELDIATKAKAKLEINMEKLKTKAVERVKHAETALAEERELNEERKKKMKTFVENKAEEVKIAKECANDMQKELEETRASLRSSRDREEALQKELEATRLKNRELQREMERMKRSSEQLHQAGSSLEQELEKYASETEEHKKKRMSAKHEIMQMVRTLESEKAVSAKLKEAVKFTLTPKALSQQELLTECLRDFELELERLAIRTGKALQPSAETYIKARDETTNVTEASEINGSFPRKSKKSRSSKADVDTERLISILEQETQHVSKGIMALAVDIERMRSLLNDENIFGCMSYFTNILSGTGEARHQRLTGNDTHPEENNTANFV
ncbi:hypothetical protein ACHAW5_001096 [Stephanodiscus triporus]|uniref:Uncharacterized protein n=1 Tax=Stephanodiscus triporus TaxID=2934178 RepID=A0ABD3Q1V5_9STRA